MSLSNKISNKISNELGLDKEKTEIINYGLFALIQIITSLILVTIGGLFFGIVFQALVVSFVSSILRQYSGGTHASQPIICQIIGTTATLCIAYIATLVNYHTNKIIIILIICLILLIYSYYILYKKAPVDSKAKPINNIDKKKRMKRNSLIIQTFYLILSMILVIFYYLTKNKNYIEYLICICLAFSWQVFSLTIIGNKILTKIDSLISTILHKQRRKS